MTRESLGLDCYGLSCYAWICWNSVSILRLQLGSHCVASSVLCGSCPSCFCTAPGQGTATTSLLSERCCTEVTITGNTCLIDCIQREGPPCLRRLAAGCPRTSTNSLPLSRHARDTGALSQRPDCLQSLTCIVATTLGSPRLSQSCTPL